MRPSSSASRSHSVLAIWTTCSTTALIVVSVVFMANCEKFVGRSVCAGSVPSALFQEDRPRGMRAIRESPGGGATGRTAVAGDGCGDWWVTPYATQGAYAPCSPVRLESAKKVLRLQVG